MPFSSNNLNDNTNYTLAVTAVTGPVAVTVLKFKTNGSIAIDVLTTPNGSFSVGNGVARVTFMLSGLVGDSGSIKVTQSGSTLYDRTWGASDPLDHLATFTIV
jgi:hypothetical protein